nr:hypothetical protein [Tanacetum cinerariifolium]
ARDNGTDRGLVMIRHIPKVALLLADDVLTAIKQVATRTVMTARDVHTRTVAITVAVASVINKKGCPCRHKTRMALPDSVPPARPAVRIRSDRHAGSSR